MAKKLSVQNVYKIFGDQADAALDRLNRGETKEQILEATGATVGVQNVSFDVEEGEIFVVMGLSGSGKSTLVRMINGLNPPTSGQIQIDGEDLASGGTEGLRRLRREKVAMVFQHFALFPHWSVVDNVAYGLKIKGVGASERREKAMHALEQVALVAWADSFPAELSGGMQQRVGLARGLATDPEVLLMDEPFSALDPLIRREMQDELLELQASLKKTIVFITHDLNEALLLGDKIAIMKDGAVVQIGTAQEIVAHPADDYVAAFVADIDRGRVFKVEDIADRPESVQLGIDTGADAMRSMEELNRNALFVLDGERIVGVVTYQSLSAAVRENGSERAAIEGALITDFEAVNGNTQLHDVYGAASSGLPIAVTDSENRLVGVVESEAVLAQLSAETSRSPAPNVRATASEEEERHA